MFDHLLLDKISKQFVNEQITHTLLEYNQIPNYIDINYRADNSTIDTMFDYRTIIKDYDELSDYVLERYNIISKLI